VDIDNQLGVRKLVQTNGKQDDNHLKSAPKAKSRQPWSTNDGSIIYAQSDEVKNHYRESASYGKISVNNENNNESTLSEHPDRNNKVQSQYMTLSRNKNKFNHQQRNAKVGKLSEPTEDSASVLKTTSSDYPLKTIDIGTNTRQQYKRSSGSFLEDGDHEDRQTKDKTDQSKWSNRKVITSDLLF